MATAAMAPAAATITPVIHIDPPYVPPEELPDTPLKVRKIRRSNKEKKQIKPVTVVPSSLIQTHKLTNDDETQNIDLMRQFEAAHGYKMLEDLLFRALLFVSEEESPATSQSWSHLKDILGVVREVTYLGLASPVAGKKLFQK